MSAKCSRSADHGAPTSAGARSRSILQASRSPLAVREAEAGLLAPKTARTHVDAQADSKAPGSASSTQSDRIGSCRRGMYTPAAHARQARDSSSVRDAGPSRSYERRRSCKAGEGGRPRAKARRRSEYVEASPMLAYARFDSAILMGSSIEVIASESGSEQRSKRRKSDEARPRDVESWASKRPYCALRRTLSSPRIAVGACDAARGRADQVAKSRLIPSRLSPSRWPSSYVQPALRDARLTARAESRSSLVVRISPRVFRRVF